MSRRLGSDGPEISAVGFGSWAIGGPWKFGWGPVDDEESVAAVRHAVTSGVTWIDTAPVYGLGHAEEVVARAIEPFSADDDVLVFTKCGRTWEGTAPEIEYDLRPDSIRLQCDESLRRLRVERIDLYQFHWPDFRTNTPVEESWGTMGDLRDEGKVRWLGVCNFDLIRLQQCEAVRHVDSLQISLSLLNRHALGELLDWCAANGTGVLAYSPLGGGLLTGAFTRERLATLPPDDWRRSGAPFREPKLSQNLELVEQLRTVADNLGCSVAALSIAWVLAAPGLTAAIAGARRPDHVDGWLGAAEVVLDPDTLAELERAVEETGAGTTEPPSPPPA